jgi:hypothetical protein
VRLSLKDSRTRNRPNSALVKAALRYRASRTAEGEKDLIHYPEDQGAPKNK